MPSSVFLSSFIIDQDYRNVPFCGLSDYFSFTWINIHLLKQSDTSLICNRTHLKETLQNRFFKSGFAFSCKLLLNLARIKDFIHKNREFRNQIKIIQLYKSGRINNCFWKH